jgi:hypothetical protein
MLLNACLDEASERRPTASRLALGPIDPPPTVDHVVAVRESDGYRLTWPPLPRGEVRLFAGTLATPCPGAVVPTAELDQLGQRVDVAPCGPTWAVIRDDDHAVSWTVVPITVDGPVATIGRSVVLSPIDDVNGLVCTIREGSLGGWWEWPAGVRHARVVITADRWPDGPDDRLADATDISRASYDIGAGFLARPPRAKERVHVVVYSADYHIKARFASGSADGCRRILQLAEYRTLRYRVAPRAQGGHGRSPYELVIRADVPMVLPELVLRAMPGGLPLHPRDGRTLLVLEKNLPCGPRDPVHRPIPPLDQTGAVDWTVRLFPTDDHECDRVTLDPGPEGWPRITG